MLLFFKISFITIVEHSILSQIKEDEMDKRWVILLGCVLLGGCVAHETDFQVAQEERDAMLLNKRMKEGCQFVRDQDAYRECLLNTYYSQYPKGYRTAELVDGEPIAVISNSQSYQGQRMVSQVAPLPSAGPQIVPYSTSEVTTVDSTYTQDYVAPQQTTIVKSQEIVAQVPVPPPAPVVQPVVIPQPVVTPAPQKDPSWWENYQQTRVITPTVTVKCPCDDPNDPCPQCYEK